LFLLAYPLLFSQPSSLEQQLELALAEPFPNYLTRKGEAESTETLRLEMAEAYNAKKYEQAINLGNQLVQTSNQQIDDLFFLGLSHLYQGELSSAISFLELARQSGEKDGRFQEEIDWYLAIAYLKNEDWAFAKSLLVKIAEKEQWNEATARTLLKKLE
jgi:Flp pilus assembly protein TadD